jgi:calpain-7
VTLHEGIGERETGYTVLVYSHSAVHWEKPRVALPFSKQVRLANRVGCQYTQYSQITNTFTSTNAGGNSTYPTFMNNPQYRLQVHPSTKGLANSRASNQNVFNVVVRCGRDMPVNIMLVWSGGSRVFEYVPGDRSGSIADWRYRLAQPDVAMESGAYTYGFASASGSLRRTWAGHQVFQHTHNEVAGQYTLIISGHSPRHQGPFQLSVESVERFELEPIPQEGAGMYSKSMIGDWCVSSSAPMMLFLHFSQVRNDRRRWTLVRRVH